MHRLLVVLAALTAMASLPGQGSSLAAPQSQSPPRDTRQTQKTGTARIRGRVIVADTGLPVRRAVVQLMSADLTDQRSTASDADGKYEFPNLPPGRFRVIVSKDGFLLGRYGSRGPGDLGRTLKLDDGQAFDCADIRMTRGSAIVGRVTDEFGEPAVNVTVVVSQYATLGMTRRLGLAGSPGRTDDLGHYRVYGLSPGTYYVSAIPTNAAQPEAATQDRAGYAPTYYPGTPELAQAQAVRVEAGQDATGTDLMLVPVRLARISGVVLDAQGRPTANGSVTASLMMGGAGFGGNAAGPKPDGTFVLPNLAPGEYVLTARSFPQQPQAAPGPSGSSMQLESGRARVLVSGDDVSGVILQTTLGGTLSGRIIFDGAASNRSMQRMFVFASPSDPMDSVGSSSRQEVAAIGTFSLTGLFGAQLLRVSGQPAGWTLKAVYVNGRDVTDAPLTFEGREQLTDAQIVLTDKVTHVNGSVRTEAGDPADGAYVLVLADDPARWTYQTRYRAATSYSEGTPFRIDGLPPGDYFAFATPELPMSMDLLDPEVVKRLRKAATSFTLKEGETRTLALTVVQAP